MRAYPNISFTASDGPKALIQELGSHVGLNIVHRTNIDQDASGRFYQPLQNNGRRVQVLGQ